MHYLTILGVAQHISSREVRSESEIAFFYDEVVLRVHWPFFLEFLADFEQVSVYAYEIEKRDRIIGTLYTRVSPLLYYTRASTTGSFSNSIWTDGLIKG